MWATRRVLAVSVLLTRELEPDMVCQNMRRVCRYAATLLLLAAEVKEAARTKCTTIMFFYDFRFAARLIKAGLAEGKNESVLVERML